MSKVIDMEGVKRGKAHLERAAELGKLRTIPARPVPLDELVKEVPLTVDELMEKTPLTVDELAALVRLHPLTIRRDIKAGKLTAAKGGQNAPYRISKTDASNWWKARGGGELFSHLSELDETTRQQVKEAEKAINLAIQLGLTKSLAKTLAAWCDDVASTIQDAINEKDEAKTKKDSLTKK
jgi:excisionase family DNA binding protein